MASRLVWGQETVISNITFQTSLCSSAKGDTRISLVTGIGIMMIATVKPVLSCSVV